MRSRTMVGLALVVSGLCGCYSDMFLELNVPDESGQMVTIERPFKWCSDDGTPAAKSLHGLKERGPCFRALDEASRGSKAGDLATKLEQFGHPLEVTMGRFYDIGLLRLANGDWFAAAVAFQRAERLGGGSDVTAERERAVRLAKSPPNDTDAAVLRGSDIDRWDGTLPIQCTGPLTIENLRVTSLTLPLLEAGDGCDATLKGVVILGYDLPDDPIHTSMEGRSVPLLAARGSAHITVENARLEFGELVVADGTSTVVLNNVVGQGLVQAKGQSTVTLVGGELDTALVQAQGEGAKVEVRGGKWVRVGTSCYGTMTLLGTSLRHGQIEGNHIFSRDINVVSADGSCRLALNQVDFDAEIRVASSGKGQVVIEGGQVGNVSAGNDSRIELREVRVLGDKTHTHAGEVVEVAAPQPSTPEPSALQPSTPQP